jgi:hypothetical protein
MATDYNVPFWGRLPQDQDLLEACENGKCFVDTHPQAAAAAVLKDLCNKTNAVYHALLRARPTSARTLDLNCIMSHVLKQYLDFDNISAGFPSPSWSK